MSVLPKVPVEVPPGNSNTFQRWQHSEVILDLIFTKCEQRSAEGRFKL